MAAPESKSIVYSHDIKGIFTCVSPSVTDVLGYEVEEFLTHYSEYFTENPINQKVEEHSQGSIRGEQQPPYLVEIRHKNGNIRLLKVLEKPVLDDQGKVTSVEGFAYDITEEMASQQKLLNQEELYRNVVENTEDILCSMSSDGTITFVSKQAARYGYRPEELVSKRYDEVVFPDDLEMVSKNFRKALETKESASFEFRLMDKQGQPHWIENRGGVILNDKGEILSITSVLRDISQRKAAEYALLEREARLREAQELAHVGHWSLDLTANELVWSEEIYRIFGMDPEKFAASYEAFLDVIHPEDRDRVSNAYAESLENRTEYAITHRITLPSGEIRFVHEQCKSTYDSSGKPLFSMGTVQDITEQVQADTALRSEKDFTDSLINQAPGIFFLYEIRDIARLSRWNKNHETDLGYSADELRDMTPIDFFGEDEHTKISEAEARVAEGQDVKIEASIRTREGKLVPYRLVAKGFADGDKEYFFGFGMDISEERRQAKRFRTLFDSSSDAIFVVAPNGKFLEVNEVACERLGYSRKELLTMGPAAIGAPQFAEDVPERLKSVQLQGEAVFETAHVAKDGRTIPTEINARLIDYDGQQAYLAVARDITDRKANEEELRKYGEHLEELVRERTTELEDANQQLKSFMMLAETAGCKVVSGFMLNLPPGKVVPLQTPEEAWRDLPGAVAGKPVEGLINEQLAELYRRIDRRRQCIVAAGGVFTAEDAYRKIRLGAAAVQLLTGMVYGGPGVVARINRGLSVLLERDGFASIEEAVGADHQ